MRFYKLTAAEREKVEVLNETREDVLLIICDYGEGRIGVDADAIESPTFQVYLTELGSQLEPTQIITIDEDGLNMV